MKRSTMKRSRGSGDTKIAFGVKNMMKRLRGTQGLFVKPERVFKHLHAAARRRKMEEDLNRARDEGGVNRPDESSGGRDREAS